MKRTLPASLFLVFALFGVVRAQVIQPPFDLDYSFVDLGDPPAVPSPLGGITFAAGDSNTLLIGGAANSLSGKIYAIGVTRDAGGHITGFAGDAVFYANAAGPGGGIDGGLAFGPGGVLFFTTFSDNHLGQLKPGSTTPDSLIALSSLSPTPIASSVGTLAFVPPGFPGAGRFKIAQYSGTGNWYDVTLAPNAGGTYDITGVTLVRAIGFGPEGIIYVPGGNPQIAADSVIVSEYGGGSVSVYDADANGDPVVATRRVFMSGLSGAEGAVIDPLTGDFLFSTFGGGSRVLVVRGFLVPSTTSTTLQSTTTSSSSSSSTSTSSSPTSSSSSTSSSTTSSSTSSSSSSSSSTSSSTTSTTVPGDCGQVPVGPTFPSLVCRLDALSAATGAEPALEAFAEKLSKALGKADQRLDGARVECADGDAKHSRSQLKKVVRALIQYSHRLRGRPARKKVPEEVREPFAATADAIQEDARTLRESVVCPDDA